MAGKFMTLPQALALRKAVQPGFKSITTVAAESLEKTRGSINDVVHGTVSKLGHTAPWDMADTWVGRELVRWRARESLWDKSIRVTFDCMIANGGGHMPIFALSLKPPLTKEEIEMSAETHMLLLNLTRKEK